ncbi:MAG: hypothetical protein JWQ73_4220 [Variovorax sp.]|nr:hypothetical protein [Variovorax sp.]
MPNANCLRYNVAALRAAGKQTKSPQARHGIKDLRFCFAARGLRRFRQRCRPSYCGTTRLLSRWAQPTAWR